MKKKQEKQVCDCKVRYFDVTTENDEMCHLRKTS